jgi:hypothetical protein
MMMGSVLDFIKTGSKWSEIRSIQRLSSTIRGIYLSDG